MTKRKGFIVLLLIAALGVGVLVRHQWVLAEGRQEIISSFAADKSGIENRFLDFPTKGPIVCDSANLGSPHRALAGRFDPVAFKRWAKRRASSYSSSWNADFESPYRRFIRNESLIEEVGLPPLIHGNGDKVLQFGEGGRLSHTLQVNVSQGTFMYYTVRSYGDGENGGVTVGKSAGDLFLSTWARRTLALPPLMLGMCAFSPTLFANRSSHGENSRIRTNYRAAG